MTFRLSELPIPNRYPDHHRKLHQHHTIQQLQTLVSATRRLVVVLESEGLEGPEISAVREALKKLGEPEE